MRVVCTVCRDGGGGDNPPYNCGMCGGQKTMVKGHNNFVLPEDHRLSFNCDCKYCKVFACAPGTVTISYPSFKSVCHVPVGYEGPAVIVRNDTKQDVAVSFTRDEQWFLNACVGVATRYYLGATYIPEALFLSIRTLHKFHEELPRVAAVDPESIIEKIKAGLA